MNAMIKSLGLILLVSCNPETEEQNKRVLGALSSDAVAPGSNSIIPKLAELQLSLVDDIGSIQDYSVASALNDQTMLLFGSTGRSLSWSGDSKNMLEPVISVTDDQAMYTLGENDFWMLEKQKLTRPKSVSSDGSQITLHTFDIALLAGDHSNIKVLGISEETIILDLVSHIAILSVKDGQPLAYELEKSLPDGVSGAVISAGKINDQAYWLLTSDNFLCVLKYQNETWNWFSYSLKTNLSEPVQSISLRIEEEQIKGTVIALTNSNIYVGRDVSIRLPSP